MDEVILAQTGSLNVWKKGGRRAPHKPLLLLMTLASVQRGEGRLTSFEVIEERLGMLLRDFGPARSAHHPEYPFWRLQRDGDFWVVPEREELLRRIAGRPRRGDVPKAILKDVGAHGGFSEAVYAHLSARPELVNELTARVLQAHFPSSLHEPLLDAVGMPWVPVIGRRRPRDAAFREAILRIYERRCAVCGFDGMLAGSNLGVIEAAHVQWHAAGGPDREDNGVALCVFHHKVFDRGALGLDPDRRVIVSQHVHGQVGVDEMLLRFSGRRLLGPQPDTPPVARAFIDWHRREVFRDPPRAIEAAAGG